MDEERLEQELRDYFKTEVKKAEPTSEWWDNVISRVTKPAKVFSFWEHIARIFSKPVLRAALPVAVVLIVIGTLWGMGVLPGMESGKSPGSIPGVTTPAPITEPKPTPPPTTTTPPQRSLRVTAVTDKASYLPGEKVELRFSLANITGEPLTLNNFPPYTEISHQGILVRTFERGSQAVKLEPGESKTYTIIWDQLDSQGNPVNPAVYQVAAQYISITKGSLSAPYREGYSEIVPIVIEFPQGAMQKTIEVNQSQTVGGVTVTLNRVELSDTEMKIYLLKTPVPPKKDPLEPPDWRGKADIQGTYRVDDGDTLETGSFGWLVRENAVEYVSGNLYPVPSDAQILYFTITRLSIPNVGDYGPFEFKVPLQ